MKPYYNCLESLSDYLGPNEILCVCVCKAQTLDNGELTSTSLF